MEWMFPGALSKVKSGLYQGNYLPSQDRQWLDRNRITAIVNATNDYPCKFKDEGIAYCHIEVDDHPDDASILEDNLTRATEFIG